MALSVCSMKTARKQSLQTIYIIANDFHSDLCAHVTIVYGFYLLLGGFTAPNVCVRFVHVHISCMALYWCVFDHT